MKATNFYTFREALSMFMTYPASDPNQYNTSLSFDTEEFKNWVITALEEMTGRTASESDYAFNQWKFMEWDSDTSAYVVDDDANEVINLVFNRYADVIAMAVDYNYYQDITTSELNHYVRIFFSKVLNILQMTFDKYKLLLANYNDLKNKIIKGKDSSYKQTSESSGEGTSRFNDTPQNQGDFASDSHTTNYSKNTNEADAEVNYEASNNDLYPVEKLELLYKKYTNIMLEWSNEFKILGGGLDE